LNVDPLVPCGEPLEFDLLLDPPHAANTTIAEISSAT
jgi:hypothetical protein